MAYPFGHLAVNPGVKMSLDSLAGVQHFKTINHAGTARFAQYGTFPTLNALA
jgi:hypothetical protein